MNAWSPRFYPQHHILCVMWWHVPVSSSNTWGSWRRIRSWRLSPATYWVKTNLVCEVSFIFSQISTFCDTLFHIQIYLLHCAFFDWDSLTDWSASLYVDQTLLEFMVMLLPQCPNYLYYGHKPLYQAHMLYIKKKNSVVKEPFIPSKVKQIKLMSTCE